MHAPLIVHAAAIHRVLRYLKGALGQGFLYKCHGYLNVEAYANTDWVLRVREDFFVIQLVLGVLGY